MTGAFFTNDAWEPSTLSSLAISTDSGRVLGNAARQIAMADVSGIASIAPAAPITLTNSSVA